MIDTVTKNYDIDNTFCSYQVTYVGTTTWKDHVANVKTANPIPTE